MNFKANYERLKNFVDQNLLHYLPCQEDKQMPLYDAMRYSLEAGGKRFRPVLHLGTIELLKGDIHAHTDSAVSLEYIHTYSLIHDDLPAMDNDDFRRGKPTNHKVFGEDMAILAGDALLNRAFEILFEKIEKQCTLPIAQGASLIARSAGMYGMVAGQVCDILSQGEDIALDELQYMHRKKTGALIASAVLSAARMMNATEEQMQSLSIYAEKIGIAFQIADDILDITATFEELGKPIGSDERNDKSTYVRHYGLEGAQKVLQETIDEAVRALDSFDNRDFLVELAKYVGTRTK